MGKSLAIDKVMDVVVRTCMTCFVSLVACCSNSTIYFYGLFIIVVADDI
jgi:hypothetical protein